MNRRMCKDPLVADAGFCPGCGAAVARAAEPPPIPREIRERAANFKGWRWFLDEVARWIDEGEKRYLLITGAPGSGKTALTTTD